MAESQKWPEDMLRKIAREAVEKQKEAERKLKELEDSLFQMPEERLPDGFVRVETYLSINDRVLFVIGCPSEKHSCDEMQCGTSHVVAKIPVWNVDGWDFSEFDGVPK